MSWDFSPQWGCLNTMPQDYLNDPYSLLNHYAKMKGQGLQGQMTGFNPHHAFRRPHPMRSPGTMHGNPSMNMYGSGNGAWQNTLRPLRMYPNPWEQHLMPQHNMMAQNNMFAQDVSLPWQQDFGQEEPEHYENQDSESCHQTEQEHVEDSYNAETFQYPYQETDLHDYAEDSYQPLKAETFQYSDQEQIQQPRPQPPRWAFDFSQPSRSSQPPRPSQPPQPPRPSQPPPNIPGPVRRRHRKKRARGDVPYQRTQPTSAAVQTLLLQLKQLGDNLQVLSVEWKEEKQELTAVCVAVYDEDALTNVIWLVKSGSYVFTLFGKTGIKMEAYGLSNVGQKKDAYFVSVSGRCTLKVSQADESNQPEAISMKRKTCDRNLLDALVMEDCFTMTEENTTQTFYKMCVAKADDFIMLEDGLLFDTRLNNHEGTGHGNNESTKAITSENSKKRKAHETCNDTVSKSNLHAGSSIPWTSVSPVAGTSSDSTTTDENTDGNTTVENPHDISSFVILDSTINRSVDLEGDLGSECEDETNENEPPNKRAKGNENDVEDAKPKARNGMNILRALKMKAEELMSSISSGSFSKTVKERKTLKAKRNNFQAASIPTIPTESTFKSYGTATVENSVKNKSLTSPGSSVTTSSNCVLPVGKSQTSSPGIPSGKKSFPVCATSALLSTVSKATTESTVPAEGKPSEGKPAEGKPSDAPDKQLSCKIMANRSFTSVEDLENKEMLLLLRFNGSGKVYFVRGTMKNASFKIPFALVASEKYEARMFELESLASSSQPYYSINRVSNYLTFTTQMTLTQLDDLQGLAESFIFANLPKYHHLNHFYRNKPDAYFDNIFDNHNGVMKPYMKDFNGDQGSPINGKLKGLFFSASVNYANGKIPPTSCFGEKRLYIPGDLLFSKDMCLYFTDFYCTTSSGKGPHYVTLVMTKKNSGADNFCRARLPLLNPFNNPFLYKQKQKNGWQVFTCTTLSTLHIEVLYTEDVDIKTLLQKHKHEVSFEYVEIFGRGQSSAKGIPKNRRCPTCNNLNKFAIGNDQYA